MINHLKYYFHVSSLEYKGKNNNIKITTKFCEDVPKVRIFGDDSVKNYTNGQI